METATHSGSQRNILSRHGMAEVWFNTINGHHSLHAAVPFEEGDVICDFHAATTQRFPTYLTVQIEDERHITLSPTFLQYINHSCEPNVFFDTTTMKLICLKAIRPADEFCFFYPSTEWEMAQPFACNCRSPKCLQLINGASNLSEDSLGNYRLTDFILKKLQEKK